MCTSQQHSRLTICSRQNRLLVVWNGMHGCVLPTSLNLWGFFRRLHPLIKPDFLRSLLRLTASSTGQWLVCCDCSWESTHLIGLEMTDQGEALGQDPV